MCILPPIKALLKIIWLIFFYKSCGGLVAKSCPTLVTPWTVATRLLCPWNSSGKNTGVGCHFLFQGISPTQGSNPGLPHCKLTLYHLKPITEAILMDHGSCLDTKSCPTLYHLMDCSPPGSSIHGISQARILEWVATSFSKVSSDPGMEPTSLAFAGRFFTSEPSDCL